MLDLALFNWITLADPLFYVADSIDVLLGADNTASFYDRGCDFYSLRRLPHNRQH